MVDAWDQFPDPPKPQNESDPWSQFPDHSLSWADVPGQAISNLPSSALGVVEGIANTVMHPIDTAQGLYNIGKGAVSKAAGALGVEQDPETKAKNEAAINAVGQFFADRYGGMENFKKTIAEDPAGFALDLSTILSGGQAALARVPGAARAATTVGKVAEATNPVNLAGRAVTGIPIPKTGLKAGVEPIVSNVLGMTTGTGEGPVRQAARAGFEGNKALVDSMRGNVPMTGVVEQAQSAVRRMGEDRGAAYKAGMSASTSGDTWINYQPINDAVRSAHDIVYYKGIAKDDAAAKVLQDIQEKIGEWRDIPIERDATGRVISSPYAVEAADALKQALGDIRKDTKPGSRSRAVADSVYHATKDAIVAQAPEYARVMKNYSDASDKINELQRTFSLGEKASTDTTLRKLQSTQRNNVQANYGHRNALLDELADYEPDLPYALAGQSLSSVTPRGITSQIAAKSLGLTGGGMLAGNAAGVAAINPAMLAITGSTLPFFSPRIVGEAAYAGGRAARYASPVVEAIPSAVKAGYGINVLAAPSLQGGIGPRYDEYGNLVR